MHMNKFLYFGDFLAVPAALAVFAYLAFATQGGAAGPEYSSALCAGFIAWTLAEYWIHRVLYHHAPWLSQLHERHHERPRDYIGAPSFLSCGMVIAWSYLPFFAFAPVFAAGFASGALLGYAAYMVVHHATHHWRIEPGHWLYPSRMRPIGHHARDDADFGIVTGFWDRVFGTAGRRRVQRQEA